MKILLTIQDMTGPAGGSLYVRDFALELFRQGHHPTVYCCRPGAISDQLTAAGIAVSVSVDKLGSPDIIHGNTPVETAAAILAFPHTPAIFVCHGWDSPDALAPRFPRVYRYLAVSDISRDRLVYWDGIPESRIVVHQNPVDLLRFRRRADTPDRLRRALVFSNTITESERLPIVRQACDSAEIALDVVGRGVHNVVLDPEQMLRNYDLVFARGRCALEALASGCAVILCDQLGLGELITTENYEIFRLRNFGRRTFQLSFTADAIVSQIRRYDPEDARRVTDHVRECDGLFAATEVLTRIYREAMAEFAIAGKGDGAADLRAAAQFLDSFAPHANTFALATRESERQLRELAQTLATPRLPRYEFRKIRLIEGGAPQLVRAGATVIGSLSVRNGTRHVLSSFGKYPLHLSCHWLHAKGGMAVYDGRRTAMFPPLLPGRTATYNVDVTAPDAPGEYVLRLTVVQETVAWLDDVGQFCDVPCRVG